MKKQKYMAKGKGSYDFSNDVYYSRKVRRDYEKSVRIDNIVLDIDKNGEITGIEIFKASQFFGYPKYYLKNILAGKFEFFINDEKNILKVKIDLHFDIRNAEKERIKVGESFVDDILSDIKLQNSNFQIEA